ncbi:MAG: 3-deoxy-D-manno-octulosonic acid transferase, partial [Chromatiales bacterium]|nr:3-deoxy-D-manno-octulosonic acid transferase [Chromatiales bacterium]
MSASRLLYRLLLILMGLPLLLLFIWQGWKGGIGRYPKERLGFVPKRPPHQKKPLWFHAASVGEVNAVIPLLKRFMTAHPEQPILLTTTTISGFQNAQRRVPNITHHFLPFDFNHAVQRFLKRIHPKAFFVVETEIWPNLFRECSKQGIPVEIINGRLSHKSLSSPAWVRRLYRNALTQVDQIATRSESDRDAFISLGADPAKCQTLGNIKYASSTEKERLEPFNE